MTTLSQYLDAESPDWSEPETFNLPHAQRPDAPARVRAIAPDALTPYQIKRAEAQSRQIERERADAIYRAREREQAEWEKKLADDGLAPIGGE